MKNRVLFIVFIFSLSSCSLFIVPREIKKNFNYCYNGDNTNLDSLINIKGYYMMHYLSKNDSIEGYNKDNYVSDTTRWYCMFYSDGLFMYSGYYDYNKNVFFDEQWGLYKIFNDTLKARFVESPGGMSWLKGEVWFKIIDSTAIRQICIKYDGDITKGDIEKYQRTEWLDNISSAKYVPFNMLPNPDKCWLKKEKWFWCNKEKYKSWKAR